MFMLKNLQVTAVLPPWPGLLRGRGRRPARNVITRMDEMTGPLALLSRCRDDGTRVKVSTYKYFLF